MIVRVGTANPMKVSAVRKAFARCLTRVRVEGVDVPSGVSTQPVSFGEIARGARARARAAFISGCDYSVGIEAGTFRVASVSKRPFQITLACVFDGDREGLGAGPFYEVPAGLLRAVVSSDTGSVAAVTNGKMTRERVTVDAVLMALAPFLTPKLYR